MECQPLALPGKNGKDSYFCTGWNTSAPQSPLAQLTLDLYYPLEPEQAAEARRAVVASLLLILSVRQYNPNSLIISVYPLTSAIISKNFRGSIK